MSQYWTAVVARDGHYDCKNHFGSFAADSAKSEIERSLPPGTTVVALIPGKQAQNSYSFDTNSRTSVIESRFVDLYDLNQTVMGFKD